jgi:hypothetical protein
VNPGKTRRLGKARKDIELRVEPSVRKKRSQNFGRELKGTHSVLVMWGLFTFTYRTVLSISCYVDLFLSASPTAYIAFFLLAYALSTADDSGH